MLLYVFTLNPALSQCVTIQRVVQSTTAWRESGKVTSQANRTLSDLRSQNLQPNYATEWYCASCRQFSVATTLLITQGASQIYCNGPESDSNCTGSDFCETGSDVVKPEVKFLNWKWLLWVIQCVFNACKGLLRAQRRQKSTFLHKNHSNGIYDAGSDLNIPQIYFNGP